MTRVRNLIFGFAIGVASIFPVVPAAEAMPLPVPAVNMETKGDVTNARVVCGPYRCWHESRRHHRPRYYHRHHRPRPIYRPPVRRGYNAHVEWCLSRYRSYNPATNRFLTYGGVYRVCHSPYR